MPTYRVPDVYVERRPRAPRAPAVRTDVVGFIGCEPRVRPGKEGFFVDISRFELDVAGVRTIVPATKDFDILAGATPVNGKEIGFAVVAIRRAGGTAELVSVHGAVAPIGKATFPIDDDIRIAIGTTDPWVRIADVMARPTAAHVQRTIQPRLEPVRCDDWRDFVVKLGPPNEDGLLLA